VIDTAKFLGPVAALLLLSSATTLGAVAEAPSEPRLTNGAALDRFFGALAALETRRTKTPVRILQIGDSHTANDSFSGRLRERLQNRFGAAGRGWLPAGVPYAYFRPALVTVGESGWRHPRPADAAPDEPIGIDATLAEATAPEARMTLTSAESGGFDRLALEFIARPNGSPLTVRLDQSSPLRVPTAVPTLRIKRVEFLPRHGAHEVELVETGPRPALLLAWAAERHVPGIIYENHGTIGATVAIVQKMNPSTLAFELAERRPSLVVIAFGTNEGFDDGLDLAQYGLRFRSAVATLRAKGAAVLVLGPPDGNRRDKSCSGDAINTGCGVAAGACGWQMPRNLPEVAAVQRRIAGQMGAAFWNWSAAMGGACSLHAFVGHDPPLAMPDHVHLSKAGYAAMADLLFADLMAEYDNWKKVHTTRH
jgi:lysophospholipase L1-like esterase